MRRWFLVAGILGFLGSLAFAQNPDVFSIPTVNNSAAITTGNTYQLLLASVPTNSAGRRSLTIQNNQQSGTDLCFVFIGSQIVAGTTTITTNITTGGGTIMNAGKASIVLAVGQAYTRYYPYVPSDAIFGTCATTGDTLYVDTQ